MKKQAPTKRVTIPTPSQEDIREAVALRKQRQEKEARAAKAKAMYEAVMQQIVDMNVQATPMVNVIGNGVVHGIDFTAL